MSGNTPVLVSLGSKAAYGYDPLTGKELWRVEEQGNFSSSTRPVAGHGLVYFPTGFNTAQIFAVRPDGKRRRDRHTRRVEIRPRRAEQAVAVAARRRASTWSTTAGSSRASTRRRAQEVWRSRLTGSYSASPVAADGRIYFFSEDGKATVIEAAREFKVLAENTLESGFMASPAIDGRALYLRTKTHLYRIEEPR